MVEQGLKPQTKSDVIREAMSRADWREAVRLAARLPRLDVHKAAICDARLAYTYPRFCRQIGRDPEMLIAAGLAALIARFEKRQG